MAKDRLTPLQKSIANVIARAIFEQDYNTMHAEVQAKLAKAARAIVLLYLKEQISQATTEHN